VELMTSSGTKENASTVYVTIRLKWKLTGFNRIVPKRSVFLCFLSGSVELMTSTGTKENASTVYVTIRLKWKTGFKRTFRLNTVLEVKRLERLPHNAACDLVKCLIMYVVFQRTVVLSVLYRMDVIGWSVGDDVVSC
jgi:hypothetical protein